MIFDNTYVEINLDAIAANFDAIRAKAMADIAREKKKALNDAKNELADLAVDIAGKVVGHSLTENDQSILVDQFIAELGDSQ